MSNIHKISNTNWEHRVYRLASKCATMGEATMFCRENGLIPNPTLMVQLNPNIKVKSK